MPAGKPELSILVFSIPALNPVCPFLECHLAPPSHNSNTVKYDTSLWVKTRLCRGPPSCHGRTQGGLTPFILSGPRWKPIPGLGCLGSAYLGQASLLRNSGKWSCSKFWPTKDKRREGPSIWMVAVSLTWQEMSRRHDWVTGNIFFQRCGQLREHTTSYLLPTFLQWLSFMQETCIQSLGQEDPLEEEMSTHSSILAWRIPMTE